MTQLHPLSGVPVSAEALDISHNAFHAFLRALRILAADADAQCQMMGDYNTAWELRSDVAAGRYLLAKGVLTVDEEAAVASLLSAIDSIADITFRCQAGRPANLAEMQHPAWAPLRLRASGLLHDLRFAIDRNAKFLGMAAVQSN